MFKNISNDNAFGLGVFFGLAATGAGLPAAVAGGIAAKGVIYLKEQHEKRRDTPKP